MALGPGGWPGWRSLLLLTLALLLQCSALTGATGALINVAPGGTDTAACGANGADCASLAYALINRVQDGDTVLLAPGVYLESGLRVPTGRSVTVQATDSSAGKTVVDCGQGACFQANCTAAAPSVCSSVSLVLHGFTLRNGANAQGGCLLVKGQSVTLDSMTVTNCTALDSGGAVFISGGELILTSTTVSSSYATNGDGGCIHATQNSAVVTSSSRILQCSSLAGTGGGLFLSDSSLVMTGSRVADSTSVLLGGGIYSSNATVNLTSTTVSGNQAATGGGLADQESTIVLEVTTFYNNTALTYTSDPMYGGGLHLNYSKSVTMSNSQIKGCTSYLDGGGLKAATVETLVIQSTTFSGNIAYGNGGGAIFDSCDAVVDSCTFINNLLEIQYSDGGGLYSTNGNLTVLQSNFTKNGIPSLGAAVLQQGGGLAYFVYTPDTSSLTNQFLVVNDTIFDSNQCNTGGAIYLAQVNNNINADGDLVIPNLQVELNNCHFQNNTAVSQGAAVEVYSGANITGCTFSGNTGHFTGGAINIDIKVQLVQIIDCVCENNVLLQGDGGCITVPQGFSNVTISGVTFNNNSAPEGRGGGLFQAGLAVTVDNSTFTGNSAGLLGGAVAVVGATLYTNPVVGSYNDCNFTSNHAPLGGGGLYVASSSTAVVTGSRFLNNNSTLGGAISVAEFSHLNLTSSTCTMNNASVGGGCISLQDFTQAVLVGTEASENAAVSQGGAVLVTGASQLSLFNCSVSTNSAQTGGAIWLDSNAKLSASVARFSGNVAQFQGGAVYQTHMAQTGMLNAVFTDNIAPEGSAIFAQDTSVATFTTSQIIMNVGGAMNFQGSSNCTLVDCVLNGNSAAFSANGGGIFATDTSFVNLMATNLTANRAQIGGALYAEGQATAVVLDSMFTNNTAQEGAAFVSTGSSNVTVKLSQFATNVAGASGGGMALLGSCTGSVIGCSFVANEAGGDGAGVYIARSPVAGSNIALGSLSCSNLTFDANLAPASSGAAYYDDSYAPANRVFCESCHQLTLLDTVSSLPTHFRFVWPGQNDTGTTTFAVIASSGNPVSVLQILVLDQYGNLITDEDEAVAEVQPTPRISGLLTGTSQKGIISIPAIQVSVPNGDVTPLQLQVFLSSPTQLFPTIERNLSVTFCPAGQYYSSTMYQCQVCPLGHWCAAGALLQTCPDNSFSFQPGAASLADCSVCGGGLQCQQGNSSVLQGFWVDPYSIVNARRPAVYGCDQTIGCAGYEYKGEPQQQQCLDGYEGRVCSACSGGYYGFLATCSKCSSSYKAAFWVVAVVVVGLWLVLNWLTSEYTGADTILVEMQLLAVVGAFNLDYFPSTWISSLFQIFNLTLFYPDFLGPECISTGYSFADRWVFTAVLPWAGVGFYLVKFVLGDLCNSLADSAIVGSKLEWLRCQKAPLVRRDELIKRVLNMLDLLYISVAIRCFQVYHWQQYDHKVLSVDPSILWLSTTHVEILPFAVVYTGLYIVGLPLFFAWVLSTGKLRSALHEDQYVNRYSQLYERYQRHYWWWYLPMTCGRRLAYAAVLVFFSAHPDMQAYLTFLLVLVLSLVHYFVRPHKATVLDLLVGVLLLGQYLYLLGGTANSYMTSYVAGTPSEALAGTALLLFLLAIAVVMVLELQEVWARFWVHQWALANEDKTAKRSYPKVPLIKFSALIGRSRSSSSTNELVPGCSEEGGEDVLVQLSEITDWFNPHVLSAFLRSASVADLNLLQMIRVTYSYRIPSEEEVRQAALILDCLPSVMRFSFINELLSEVEGDLTSGLLSGSGSPPSLALSKVEGLQKSKDLKVLADAAAGDKRRAGETLSLFLNPRAMEKIVAWLLYDTGLEGRRAMADLVQKFHLWLLILPREPSWFDWTKGSEKTPLQPFELNLRRKMRRFYLRLAL